MFLPHWLHNLNEMNKHMHIACWILRAKLLYKYFVLSICCLVGPDLGFFNVNWLLIEINCLHLWIIVYLYLSLPCKSYLDKGFCQNLVIATLSRWFHMLLCAFRFFFVFFIVSSVGMESPSLPRFLSHRKRKRLSLPSPRSPSIFTCLPRCMCRQHCASPRENRRWAVVGLSAI